jgi:hypothetical protein
MIKYEQICEVTSNDTDKTVTAEIISFSPQDRLIVAIAGNKLQLNYNSKGMYIGNKVGMEFMSRGPKGYEVNMGRQR